ncbi:hypothetical protein [Sphingomonas sp. BK069]|uniref:hypothetical protein n=1 Tax=Sphingomonas sp. BK069 TaxID=2586979 RepID=UPI001614C60D|nr:hypothetical protein [Sphingomonas sp. BK069]MBB3346653.1 hypothetical protein [Sphingomonas sp. BK069]
MSAVDKALSALKTVMTVKDQLDLLARDITGLHARVAALAEAHGGLRDRVSRLEGVIQGAAMMNDRPRLEE